MKNFFFNRIGVNLPRSKVFGRIFLSFFNQKNQSNVHSAIVQDLKLTSNRMLEAAAKIEQNQYSAKIGFRPDWVVSSVGQNSQLYARFAIARAITNQNWISGLNVTARL